MKKSKTILLPRGYLSYTQLALWEQDPREYVRRYIYGEQYPINAAMHYGKKLATCIETGDSEGDELIDTVARLIPRYDTVEYRLEAELDVNGYKIPLLGFADTYRTTDYAIREYKTGKWPWTQSKVDKQDQLTLYALIVYLKHKKLPADLHLDWIVTEYGQEGEISATGEIKSFATDRSLTDLMEVATRVKKAASEIQAVYQKEIQKLT